MSHVTQPTVTTRSQLRAHRIVTVSALLAFLAATAVTLVVVLDSGTPSTSGSIARPQAAIRSDGGPDESAIAVLVGSRMSPAPSESTIATAVGGSVSPHATGGYWESADPRTSYQPGSAVSVGRPDEAGIAASISGR